MGKWVDTSQFGLHGDVLVARVYYLFIRKKRAHIMSIALKMGSSGAKKSVVKQLT